MKSALFSLITATALGFAAVASGHAFDGADFVTIAFSAGLVAWTVAQYSRAPRPLIVNRPIRVSAPIARPVSTVRRPVRVAA